MPDPHISHDGTVYTDRHILHPTPATCRHEGAHACAFCDHDRYYARLYPADCPWREDQ